MVDKLPPLVRLGPDVEARIKAARAALKARVPTGTMADAQAWLLERGHKLTIMEVALALNPD